MPLTPGCPVHLGASGRSAQKWHGEVAPQPSALSQRARRPAGTHGGDMGTVSQGDTPITQDTVWTSRGDPDAACRGPGRLPVRNRRQPAPGGTGRELGRRGGGGHGKGWMLPWAMAPGAAFQFVICSRTPLLSSCPQNISAMNTGVCLWDSHGRVSNAVPNGTCYTAEAQKHTAGRTGRQGRYPRPARAGVTQAETTSPGGGGGGGADEARWAPAPRERTARHPLSTAEGACGRSIGSGPRGRGVLPPSAPGLPPTATGGLGAVTWPLCAHLHQ